MDLEYIQNLANLSAIGGIKNPENVRFVLYHNGNLSHISMKIVFADIEKRLAAIEKKLKI